MRVHDTSSRHRHRIIAPCESNTTTYTLLLIHSNASRSALLIFTPLFSFFLGFAGQLFKHGE